MWCVCVPFAGCSTKFAICLFYAPMLCWVFLCVWQFKLSLYEYSMCVAPSCAKPFLDEQEKFVFFSLFISCLKKNRLFSRCRRVFAVNAAD